jgi:hypothetical protein
MVTDDVTKSITILKQIRETLSALAMKSTEDQSIHGALYGLTIAIQQLEAYKQEREDGFIP